MKKVIMCMAILLPALGNTIKIGRNGFIVSLLPEKLKSEIAFSDIQIEVNQSVIKLSSNCELKVKPEPRPRKLNFKSFLANIDVESSKLTDIKYVFKTDKIDYLRVWTNKTETVNTANDVIKTGDIERLCNRKIRVVMDKLMDEAAGYVFWNNLRNQNFYGHTIKDKDGYIIFDGPGMLIHSADKNSQSPSLQHIFMGDFGPTENSPNGEILEGMLVKMDNGVFPYVTYIGEFKNYKAHGYGTEYNYDSQGTPSTWEGYFENGKRVYEDF